MKAVLYANYNIIMNAMNEIRYYNVFMKRKLTRICSFFSLASLDFYYYYI